MDSLSAKLQQTLVKQEKTVGPPSVPRTAAAPADLPGASALLSRRGNRVIHIHIIILKPSEDPGNIW